MRSVMTSRSRGTSMRRMRLFFDTVIDTQLARLTPERTAQLYVDFRVGRSVDYHRNTLGNAKGFLAWCVAQGWVQTNALAAVEGVGRRSVGKEQLTGDEARKLHDWCMWRARRGDEAAIGVLMLLLMALRQSDVTKRLVRDVDLDATVLRVSGGKTRRRATGRAGASCASADAAQAGRRPWLS